MHRHNTCVCISITLVFITSPVILFPLGLLIADPRDGRNQTYRDTVEPPMGHWRDGKSLFKCVKMSTGSYFIIIETVII